MLFYVVAWRRFMLMVLDAVTYSTLPIRTPWDRVTHWNDKRWWWDPGSCNSPRWFNRPSGTVPFSFATGRKKDRIDVRTRVYAYACDTCCHNTAGLVLAGGRWCAIAERPAMIYVGRADAICIASVFTGRDEATPAGWVIARARVVELLKRLKCSDLTSYTEKGEWGVI